MGGSNSRPDIAGHRVLRVENSSPASSATQHWVPYLDVLVGAGGVDLTRDSSLLSAQLKAHIGLPLELIVMNAKSLEQRSVEVRGGAWRGGWRGVPLACSSNARKGWGRLRVHQGAH